MQLKRKENKYTKYITTVLSPLYAANHYDATTIQQQLHTVDFFTKIIKTTAAYKLIHKIFGLIYEHT